MIGINISGSDSPYCYSLTVEYFIPEHEGEMVR